MRVILKKPAETSFPNQRTRIACIKFVKQYKGPVNPSEDEARGLCNEFRQIFFAK